MADNFNLRSFLTENKLTKNAKLLNENVDIAQAFSQAGITGEVTVAFHSEQGMSEPEFEVMDAQDALAMIAREAEGAEDVIIAQGDEIDQQGDLDPQTQGLECKLEVAILDHGTYEVYQGSNEEGLEEAAPKSMQAGFDMVAKGAQQSKELQAVANRMFPEFGGELTSLGAPLTPEQRKAVWATWSKEKVAQEKAEREAIQETLTAKERRLVEMVNNAMGYPEEGEDEFNPADAADEEDYRRDQYQGNQMEEGNEMADETVIPEYKNIEELMKSIEEGTNRVAEEHKVQEMKKIANALRAEAQRMEESEHAKHINPKVRKKYLQDAIKIEKAAEKLVAALEKEAKKEKPAATPKAEKVEALQEGTFDLRKFLAENRK